MIPSPLVPAAIAIAAEVFPALATKLGGRRGGELAGRIVGLAAGLAGLPKEADPREIVARLRADPARLHSLRLEFERLDQAEHERIVADRMDARSHQARAGRLRGNIMLAGVILGLCASIGTVALGAIDTQEEAGALALVTTIAGALLKMLSDAFAFEFGSSAGSREKTVHIEQIQSALMRLAEERTDRVRASEAPRPVPAETPAGPAVPLPPSDDPVPAVPAPDPAPRHDAPAPRDFVAELRGMT